MTTRQASMWPFDDELHHMPSVLYCDCDNGNNRLFQLHNIPSFLLSPLTSFILPCSLDTRKQMNIAIASTNSELASSFTWTLLFQFTEEKCHSLFDASNEHVTKSFTLPLSLSLSLSLYQLQLIVSTASQRTHSYKVSSCSPCFEIERHSKHLTADATCNCLSFFHRSFSLSSPNCQWTWESNYSSRSPCPFHLTSLHSFLSLSLSTKSSWWSSESVHTNH